MKKKCFYLYYILLWTLCLFSCRPSSPPSHQLSTHDLPQIKDSGNLVVLTLYSSISYFNYRGEPMGFQYELSEQFANSLGVKLEIKTAQNPLELEKMLLQGEGDLIAYNLPITLEGKENFIYCGEEIISHQVLIQQKNRKKKSIKDVTELIGKDIYVKPGRSLQRLKNLDKELGGGIHIHEATEDSITEEDLIALVSLGEIDYTICDNETAKLNQTY
ncbi:MAG: transporter substrate-binding domain-containing protein, partial [Bacteroidaceae bacterium]|nr:transporter substrate-binding domain-containing protein [Bacteroidaceae bacterium]